MCGPAGHCSPRAIAGCGFCRPMQSAGSMYFNMGGGLCITVFAAILHANFARCYLYLQHYKYVGRHFELCIAHGFVLCMVWACGLQPLRAKDKRDLHYIT